MLEKIKQQKITYGKKIFIAGIFILSSIKLSAEISISANLFLGRAFSANIATEMLMTGPVNQYSNDINGFFSIDAAYQRSWNQNSSQGIGAYPFWSTFNTMTVGDNSGNFNLDAYQFGLGPITPTGTTISLNPLIYQTGSDFMFYVQSQPYGHSIFAKVKSALTSMVINPNLTETDPVTPAIYPAGALSIATNANQAPSSSMIQAFAGTAGTQSVEGDFRPMTNGLINGALSTGAHLSDTEMTIGYNYTSQDTDNSVSVGLRLTAPTGNKPQGIYVLEPINGRGGNWGIGFYLAGDYNLWHSASQEDTLKLKFMGDGIHLCKQNVMRTYDLTANGNGSKYLLVADYQNNTYQNSIQNLVNLSTLESQSSFAFEGDAALSACYNSGGFSAEIGYNAWGRTAETLTILEKFQGERYAILGRQGVGQEGAGNPSINSNACQPFATINFSNSAAAQTTVTVQNVTNQSSIVDATVSANCISGSQAFNTSLTAQYAAVTSKLFAKVGYDWKDSEYCPYINIIGDCEWSNLSNNALPQWGIALIAGVSL
jgi:hypothetical protein